MADLSGRKFPHGLSGLGFLNLESIALEVSHKPLRLFIDFHKCTICAVFWGEGFKISILFTKSP